VQQQKKLKILGIVASKRFTINVIKRQSYDALINELHKLLDSSLMVIYWHDLCNNKAMVFVHSNRIFSPATGSSNIVFDKKSDIIEDNYSKLRHATACLFG